MKRLSVAALAQMRVMAGVVTGLVVILVALSGCTDAQPSSVRAADGYCTPDHPPQLCSMQRARERDLQSGY